MKPQYLVTHSGGFHADELCSSVILTRLFPEADIVRSRAPDWITPSDDRIIYDVGGQFDPAQLIFDHHQRGAPLRPDDQPYSSFGLIWAHFGQDYLRSFDLPENQVSSIHAKLDQGFVLPIDLLDNGAISPGVAGPLSALTLPNLLETLKPTFDQATPETENAAFHVALSTLRVFIEAQVSQAAAKLRAKAQVEQAIQNAGDSRILELPMGMPFRSSVVAAGADHLLFVVHPRGNDWSIGGIRKNDTGFEQRADLPAAWAGLTNEALEAASGVSGATFCHNARFIAAAKSRDAIMKMADIAVAEALKDGAA